MAILLVAILPLAGDEGADGAAADLPAFEGGIAALGAHLLGVDGPLEFGVDKGHVGALADGEGSAGDAEEFGGVGGHERDELGPIDVAGLDQGADEQRQGRFQSDDAEGGVLEFVFFAFAAVGCVVGDAAVDRSVTDAGDAGVDIGAAAQWWFHFAVGIEAGAGLVGEEEVMGGDFGGDALAGSLGCADEVNRSRNGDVGDVVADADLPGEGEVALCHDDFGGAGDAGQAEAGGGGAGVHAAAAGE